jgi:hypothetical protein
MSVLALDIGGTKLAAGVVDDDARVRSVVVPPSHAERGPDAVLLAPLHLPGWEDVPHVLLRHQLVERIDVWAAGELEEAG